VSGPAESTPEKIESAFRHRGFVCTGEVATTLYPAERLGEPHLDTAVACADPAGPARGAAELQRRL
jgi:hypothetical protein